jgi:uncharacterized protein YvpB
MTNPGDPTASVNPTPSAAPLIAPTYSGAKEVLVGQPVTLKGSYDTSRIAKLTLAAEDRHPLNIRYSQGTWQVFMSRGFSVSGARWLRIRGYNSANQEQINQLFYITVSRNPLTVGQQLTLKVLRDTFFKVSPQDSSKLNAQQKVLVRAGHTVAVVRYGWIDAHLKVELASTIDPIGDFGYFYGNHIELSKGTEILRFNLEDVPDSPADGVQVLVTTTTFIKASTADSTSLPSQQKAQILQGQTLAIRGYACVNGHFRVTLRQPIEGFGSVGYLYWRHVTLSREGRTLPFDPDSLTFKVLQTTLLKKQPVDSSKLATTEKVTLSSGSIYGVSSYSVEGGHIKVSTTEEFPNFGNTGFVFPAHVQMQRSHRSFNSIPPQVELAVPYFSQRDNPRLAWATCNVTAIAMVFYYYGIRSKDGGQLENELLQWCFDHYGYGSQTDHTCLSELIRAYGFQAQFSTTHTWQEVKEELINQRPVVLCGYFTPYGHIITLIGYTPYGYIVNDPWGDGYEGYVNMEGRKLLYPYSYCDTVAGPDGQVWAHFIRKA